MNILHVYNGIYYAWETNRCTPDAGSGIQSFEGILNVISCKFIKQIQTKS